jgi:hypothetical protein
MSCHADFSAQNAAPNQLLEYSWCRRSAKHASWLNMVEIEIGVPRRQFLDRRIDDPKILIPEIAARERQRNEAAPA